jgi:catechol 2,3-dioxygenase-like lactoylglutathione lyase family enzyme
MKFNALMPELYVSNFKKSLNFYTEILGFKLEYQRYQQDKNNHFAFMSYYDAQLMIEELVSGEQEEKKLEYPFGRGMNFEIRTLDLLGLIEILKKNDYPLSREMTESWRDIGIQGKEFGSREFRVLDPDGFELRFAQDLGERDSQST